MPPYLSIDAFGAQMHLYLIDAHVGGVNDIAFAHPNKQLCIVRCGDDKTIKVWDAVAGRRQYIFEGHETPVYSVCPIIRRIFSLFFPLPLMGKLKHGSMISSNREWIMMPLDFGALQWHIALMEPASEDLPHEALGHQRGSGQVQVLMSKLLTGMNNHYGGVIVEMTTEPKDPAVFVFLLRTLVSHWKQQNSRDHLVGETISDS
ncbi:Protein TPR3 [Camellia lanceoleosa]|uniref:Protein TPR3 n=1 Tax=Camellia lanceoleosa TaxID=1840588 RepID=A0ACC0HJI2_9ERIC|nr:Protein TPR3 [Camellia lanceoleosa]